MAMDFCGLVVSMAWFPGEQLEQRDRGVEPRRVVERQAAGQWTVSRQKNHRETAALGGE